MGTPKCSVQCWKGRQRCWFCPMFYLVLKGCAASSTNFYFNKRNLCLKLTRLCRSRQKNTKQTERTVVLMIFNYIKWIYVKVEKEEKHWVSSSPSCSTQQQKSAHVHVCTGQIAGHLYSSQSCHQFPYWVMACSWTVRVLFTVYISEQGEKR